MNYPEKGMGKEQFKFPKTEMFDIVLVAGCFITLRYNVRSVLINTDCIIVHSVCRLGFSFHLQVNTTVSVLLESKNLQFTGRKLKMIQSIFATFITFLTNINILHIATQ